jgi:hypothetical protein
VSSVGAKAEAVKFTTNTLNIPKTTQEVEVSGTETGK